MQGKLDALVRTQAMQLFRQQGLHFNMQQVAEPLHIAESSAPLCGKIVCADIGIRDEWHPEF